MDKNDQRSSTINKTGGTPLLTIAGAGVGGLAAAWYASRVGIACRVLEAGGRAGGNALTIERPDGFSYDSGAHRYHDRNPEVTADLKQLMGDLLVRVEAPSQIFFAGRFIDFPLSPLNLIASLGIGSCLRGARDLIRARIAHDGKPFSSFADFALTTYGRTIAERFLLNYSEKLWGKQCKDLSPAISGKRMEGLNVRTFLVEALRGKRAKTEHLDGAFYYPQGGIGKIADHLAVAVDPEVFQWNCSVTRVCHDHSRVTSVAAGGKRWPVEELLITFSLPRLIAMMDPPPPSEILETAAKLRTRHVVLVALFLEGKPLTANASLYFPERRFLFTRIYEPPNRCGAMAPPGNTSLVAEIPCGSDDGEKGVWERDDAALIAGVTAQMAETGLLDPGRVLSGEVYRMRDAYPVLERGYEEKVALLTCWLSRFANLHLSGRNGAFAYIHIHDLLAHSRKLAAQLAGV